MYHYSITKVRGYNYTANAQLTGKKWLAKIVNGVKQPTVFCPFEGLVSCTLHIHYPSHVLFFLLIEGNHCQFYMKLQHYYLKY